MRILNANFLIDYLNAHPSAETYYESNGSDTELWVMPALGYAEPIVGVGNLSSGDVEEAIDALSWGEIYEINRDLSVEAGRIADEVGQQGPYLDGSTHSLLQSAANSTRRLSRQTATSRTRGPNRLSKSKSIDNRRNRHYNGSEAKAHPVRAGMNPTHNSHCANPAVNTPSNYFGLHTQRMHVTLETVSYPGPGYIERIDGHMWRNMYEERDCIPEYGDWRRSRRDQSQQSGDGDDTGVTSAATRYRARRQAPLGHR